MPIEEWPGELVVRGKVNHVYWGAEAKASLNRAILVACTRPETRWSNHEQDEILRNQNGGPNYLELQIYEMTCG